MMVAKLKIKSISLRLMFGGLNRTAAWKGKHSQGVMLKAGAKFQQNEIE